MVKPIFIGEANRSSPSDQGREGRACGDGLARVSEASGNFGEVDLAAEAFSPARKAVWSYRKMGCCPISIISVVACFRWDRSAT